MGREEYSDVQANSNSRSFRKPPPSVGVPGAHAVGGPGSSRGYDDFGQGGGPGLDTNKVSSYHSYYANDNNGAAKIAVSKTMTTNQTSSSKMMMSKKEGDTFSNKSSTAEETTTSNIEDSCFSVGRIPLEMDYFDTTGHPKSNNKRRLLRVLVDDRCKEHIIPILLMIVTAILAIIIPCAVIFSGRNAAAASVGGEDRNFPRGDHLRPTTPPPKPNMTLTELQAIVPNLTESTLQKILQDDFSPQTLALDWVSKEDPNDWMNYDDFRKIQRFALVVTYYALDGPRSWEPGSFSNRFWLDHRMHECDWLGPMNSYEICDDEERITNLELKNQMYLRGSFPTEIELLDRLQSINLTSSDIADNITSLFSTLLLSTSSSLEEEEDDNKQKDLSHFLPNLETLVLRDTRLTGSIPSFLSSGGLSKLTYLDLSRNDLESKIPSELGLLTSLETLILSDNDFSGTIPLELNNLSQLRTFTVQGNELLTPSPLPETFCSDHGGDKEEDKGGKQSPPPMIELTTDWCHGPDQCCST